MDKRPQQIVPWKTSKLALDRAGATTLVDQIVRHIETAIAEGGVVIRRAIAVMAGPCGTIGSRAGDGEGRL